MPKNMALKGGQAKNIGCKGGVTKEILSIFAVTGSVITQTTYRSKCQKPAFLMFR